MSNAAPEQLEIGHRSSQVAALESFIVDVDSLPSPPTLILQILDYTNQSDLSIRRLSEMVGRDASLTAKLIRMANSSFYALSSEVTSLDKAIMVLGVKSVRLLTLSLSLSGLFPPPSADAEIVLEVRRRAVVNALANRAFLAELDPVLRDEGFLVGLLHNMGALVVAQSDPQRFEDLFGVADHWPSVERQVEVLGFELDDLTATLLDQWGLPTFLSNSIRGRGRPEHRPADDRLVVALELATFAEEVLCGVPDGAALLQLTEHAAAVMDLDTDHVSAILVDLGPQVLETAQLLSLDLPSGFDHREMVNQAAAAMHRLSIEAVTQMTQQSQHLVELERENEALARDSRTDVLTGISNRRAFDEGLEAQLAMRRRRAFDDMIALLVFDIDHFKDINDAYGHAVGDAVLTHIARLLAGHCRGGEDLYRIGGEEFVLMLPHTQPEDVPGAAERFRKLVEDSTLSIGGLELNVTVSVGAAMTDDVADSGSGRRLLHEADQLMYQAKQAGRNRYVVQSRPDR